MSVATPDPLEALCTADALWAERYAGFEVLGHGASATVVKSWSHAAGAPVALKVFQRLDADDLRRFQEEVRHSQRLASPYVIQTFSPFVRGALSWIELEWVDGPDLRSELGRRAREGRPFALAEAGAIVAALCRALVAAHAGGVVHRDVKPANVLLPREGPVPAKLGDFGIARVTGAARLTATGILAGTPQFAAPEIVAGQRADERSDIYSLALVIYQVYSTGRFPYDVPDESLPGQWLKAHVQARPRPLSDLRPDLNARSDQALLAALDKLPERRPTAGELLAAFDSGGDSRSAAEFRRRPSRSVWAAVLAAGLVGWAARGWMRVTGANALVSPSPASGSPAPTPILSPAAPAAVGLRLDGELLTLTSRSDVPLARLRIVLSDAHRSAETRPAGALRPGDELTLALDGFQPAPPAHWRPTAVDLAFEQAGQAHSIRLALP